MQKEALSEEVELEQENMEGCTEKTEWEGLIQAFLTYSKGIGRSENSLERYETALKLWMKFLREKGIKSLSEISAQVLGEYQGWLYRRKTRYGKPHTIKGQINYLSSLKVFFRYLHVSGKILANPAEDLRLPKEPKKLPGVILTNKEMKRLLAQPDSSTLLGFRDRTMYEVLYSTGLRVNELIHLQIRDFVADSLFIKQSKHYKDRYVPMGKVACVYLNEYLLKIRPVLLRGAVSARGEEIFLNRFGKLFDHSGIELKLKVYAKKAKINKALTVHVFRHTLATEMLKNGADLRQIQEVLGHRSLETTQIYTHVVKGELRRVQSHCHPREQSCLPEGFVKFRGLEN